ncbi:WD repeat-containing protein 81 [Entomortierella parvispora]|uniref:WD repeat-containing protein 81 n=1 Tax=Entomortierella parvispora TaxID=205924 RepID=A0A9P3M277_9FUNG|nr:WD repeat-containing protein 81 [Entomortierella parvispora]
MGTHAFEPTRDCQPQPALDILTATITAICNSSSKPPQGRQPIDMFGAGLDAQELTALIEQDLHLKVAFPSFSLDSSLGHTACCVLQKSWLDQLLAGTATALFEVNAPKESSSLTTPTSPVDTKSSSGEVNAFINVISKTKSLRQQGWTRVRIFKESLGKALAEINEVPDSFITRTSVPDNGNWNITAKAYIRELLDSEEGSAFKSDDVSSQPTPNYKAFTAILEGDDSTEDTDSDSHNGSMRNGACSRNKELIARVLDIIYPDTLRYRVVPSSQDQRPPRLVLMERNSGGRPTPAPANIASATVILESDSAYFCVSPHRLGGATGLTTLQDLLRFNPGNLNTSLKKGFLVYQLLKAVKGLHENGLIHGCLRPSNVYIDENLWITLTGIKCSVPYESTLSGKGSSRRHSQELSIPKVVQEESTVMKWAKGEISNYTYLMVLNHAAGRRQGDPNVHPIFPWVTDFTGSKVQHGWRDFTKTKFRLNKGDEQLDVTFDGPIPHHITDILSDITYYVYMARQIPIPVLCQFVRSKYEANEYPSSIRRLYEWTPDECIPEFYTDPSIFKSIHSDMPDMALPTWADTPEEFIRIHRQALESEYVSAHLHEWIDLTFGYRLSGKGAIESKNVALSLFPGQSAFMKHGIIQLFTDSHPQKIKNWSLSKAEYLRSQSISQTDLERASKITKRRNFYRPQSERPQFVEKVSDLLFRPAGPTRSKSIRQPTGSRPSSIVVTNGHEREQSSAAQAAIVASSANNMISPINALAQDANVTLASTRPEALVQFLQSEPIDLPKELQDLTFVEELDHFEKTFQFGSKYHFLDSSAARARISKDIQKRETNGSLGQKEDSFEYMQSWDVYCLGEIFKQIYLAEDIPNNSIAMSMKPHVSVTELTTSRHIPNAVSGTIVAMLRENWESRPKIEDILQKALPALAPQSPTISMFVPSLVAEIYDFLAGFYSCSECTQMDLASRWVDRICGFEDETFEIALPVFIHLFTTEGTRVSALSLLPKLGQRLGIKKTKIHLLKPIINLFETSKPTLPAELFNITVFNEFLRRFGTSTFLKQLFQYYLDALVVDYSQVELLADDKSSTSSLTADGASASAVSAVVEEEPIKKRSSESIPKMANIAKVASEAFVGVCRSIGPILTSKHVMKPFSRLAFKDPVSLALLKETLGGIAHEFGSTFALVQFSHIMHLMESTSSNITARSSLTLRNLLGLLGSLIPHIYDTQLVTELKNGGSEIMYRLIEPSPSKPSNRSDAQAALRLAVSRTALDLILQLSFSLTRQDWEKQIAPILQKYFSGFGPDIDEMSSKAATAQETQRNEQMMYAYGQLCSCVGQEAMQSMIPASDAIERLIAARLDSKEFGNSPLRSLGSITAQGKFVLASSNSTFWQQQKSQQAKDMAQAKKAGPFSTKDLWSATSASMSKALSLFDSKNKPNSTGATNGNSGNLGSGVQGGPPFPSAASALASVSTSASVSTLAATSTNTTSPVIGGLVAPGRDSSVYVQSERINDSLTIGQEASKSPTEVLSTGSLSPVLGSGPARKNRQNFGSPGKAKTAARLEQLSNWNRFLSTNQEEMAKSMQFAFNDWKLQGFEGHTSSVKVIGSNEYQRILATGSKDRTVKLWSLDIHRTIENPDYADSGSGCLMTYNGHRRGAVFDLHFATGGGSHGTGDIVASCDGQIHLWEPETGKMSHIFNTGKVPVVSMVPIFRSRYIVAGMADGALSFLDSHTHLNLYNWRATTSLGVTIKTVTTNAAETIIATGFSNGTVSLLESRTGTLVGQWRASDSEITQMKFYTNDILITSAPADHMVCIWNVKTSTLIKSIRGTSEIISLEIYKDEIITMHHNNSISFTPINDDSLAYTSKFKSSAIRSSISSIGILPMNQLLVLGCNEGDLYLYS